MVSSSESFQGSFNGVPANAPVCQINANSAGLVPSTDESFASVVLAGSDFSITVDKYHGLLTELFFGSGRGEPSAAQSSGARQRRAFCGLNEFIYY